MPEALGRTDDGRISIRFDFDNAWWMIHHVTSSSRGTHLANAKTGEVVAFAAIETGQGWRRLRDAPHEEHGGADRLIASFVASRPFRAAPQ